MRIALCVLVALALMVSYIIGRVNGNDDAWVRAMPKGGGNPIARRVFVSGTWFVWDEGKWKDVGPGPSGSSVGWLRGLDGRWFPE